jgi:hypothetical protein
MSITDASEALSGRMNGYTHQSWESSNTLPTARRTASIYTRASVAGGAAQGLADLGPIHPVLTEREINVIEACHEWKE